MPYFNPILIINIITLAFLLGCGENVSKLSTPTYNKARIAIFANDSIGKIVDEVILDKAAPGINSMMTYINAMVNGDTGSQFTSAQLGQVIGHFRINDPTIDKIIAQGKKYPNQNKAKQIWNEIYSEYIKGDKDKFVKNVTKYGDIYHLNGLMKEWAARHNGNQIATQMMNDKSIYDLETIGRKHEAMAITRANNACKIKEAVINKFHFCTKKFQKLGLKVTVWQEEKAVNRIMHEYILSDYKWSLLEKNMDLQKGITSDMGACFLKKSTRKGNKVVWQYIPAVYVTEEFVGFELKDNRIDTPALWIKDILIFE
jgi:hypothetical protein